MKSSKKHKFRPGLWFIIFAIIVIAGLVFTGVSVPMQRNGEPTYVTAEKASGSIMSDLSKDFKNSVGVYSDIYNVVVKGEESEYSSGYAALSGREQKGETKVSEEPAVVEENHSEPINLGKDEPSENTDLIEAKVIDVVDGDTLDVAIGGNSYRVRLIGIDTPESVNPDETKNTEWGEKASEHTKSIMNNIPIVYLEYDEEPTDKYGRTLAYVWLVNDMSDVMYMLNARIIADGYAINKVYEPNVKYAGKLQEIRESAEENQAGLWREEGFAELWQEQ